MLRPDPIPVAVEKQPAILSLDDLAVPQKRCRRDPLPRYIRHGENDGTSEASLSIFGTARLPP
jgi:hypothetical protein